MFYFSPSFKTVFRRYVLFSGVLGNKIPFWGQSLVIQSTVCSVFLLQSVSSVSVLCGLISSVVHSDFVKKKKKSIWLTCHSNPLWHVRFREKAGKVRNIWLVLKNLLSLQKKSQWNIFLVFFFSSVNITHGTRIMVLARIHLLCNFIIFQYLTHIFPSIYQENIITYRSKKNFL